MKNLIPYKGYYSTEPEKLLESKLIIEEPTEKQFELSDLHFRPIANKKIDSLKFLIEERDDH